MYKNLNILLTLSINLGILIFALESNDAEFINIDCFADNITITNKSCRLISRRHKPRAISVDFDIIKPFVNIEARFELFRRLNGYKPFLINYTFDGCQALRNKGLNPLTKILKNWVIDLSNMKVRCPVKPQHFSIKELYPDLRMIPSLIPKGRFRGNFILINKNDSTKMFAAEVHFIIKDNF